MDDVSAHDTVRRRSIGRQLLVRRPGSPARGRLASLVLGAGAAVVGMGLGRHMGGLGEPLALAQGLFSVILATSAPLPLVALGALYHDPLHASLLPWPVSGGQHLRLSLRLFGSSQWPWLVLVSAAVLTSAPGLGPFRLALCLLFGLTALVGATLASLGAAGLCAGFAERDTRWLRSLRESLAGPFASQRHAPFFYLPALAFGLTALAVSIAHEAALLPLLGATHATLTLSPRAQWTLLLLPVLLGGPLAVVGLLAYRAHALNVIARVGQEARMVYGGQPAPEDPPYGRWLARMLPAGVSAHLLKELAEQSRMQRGLWAWIILGGVALLLYSVGTGMPSVAAPVIALVVLVWLGSLPVRHSARSRGFELLVTLPVRWRQAWVGRWIALAFVNAHLGSLAAVAIGLRHGPLSASVVAACGLATTLMSTSATQPHASPRLTALVPAVGLALGLAALAWPLAGLALLTLAGVSAVLWGIRT